MFCRVGVGTPRPPNPGATDGPYSLPLGSLARAVCSSLPLPCRVLVVRRGAATVDFRRPCGLPTPGVLALTLARSGRSPGQTWAARCACRGRSWPPTSRPRVAPLTCSGAAHCPATLPRLPFGLGCQGDHGPALATLPSLRAASLPPLAPVVPSPLWCLDLPPTGLPRGLPGQQKAGPRSPLRGPAPVPGELSSCCSSRPVPLLPTGSLPGGAGWASGTAPAGGSPSGSIRRSVRSRRSAGRTH